MNSKYISFILVGGIALYLIFKAYTVLFAASTGDQAPDFTTDLIDGSEYSLSDSRGHYVLLDFWGSWCGPCIKDSPKLVALSRKYADARFEGDAKLHVVTVALEKKGDTWKRFADRFGFDWPRQIVHFNKVVLASSIANSFGVTDIPAKFLIGPDGNIITAKASFEEIDSYLKERQLP